MRTPRTQAVHQKAHDIEQNPPRGGFWQYMGKEKSMKLKTALSLALKKPPRTSDEFEKLPKHVAIIMDGNGRWAKKHKLNVSRGHRQGTETLREIIRHTDDLGIGALSLYAFSTDPGFLCF